MKLFFKKNLQIALPVDMCFKLFLHAYSKSCVAVLDVIFLSEMSPLISVVHFHTEAICNYTTESQA